MKGITSCKLTIISESAICKKFLGQIVSYPASLHQVALDKLGCFSNCTCTLGGNVIARISDRFQIVINRMLCCYLNVLFLFILMDA